MDLAALVISVTRGRDEPDCTGEKLNMGIGGCLWTRPRWRLGDSIWTRRRAICEEVE